MIPEAKRRALVEGLSRAPVVFKNGSVVCRVDEGDLRVHLADKSARLVNVHAHDQIGRAYEIALAGPPPPEPRPPAAVKPTRSRTDFGPCPF